MVNLTAAERVYEYWIDKASSAADLVLKIVFAVILFLVARKLILWLCGLIRKNMRRFNTEEAVGRPLKLCRRRDDSAAETI